MPLMKKIILFLLFAGSLTAQEFKGGVRGGISGSQVHGDRLSGFDKTGLLGGVFVNRSLSDRVSLQMEIIFIQKGSRKPTDDNNTFYRLRVHYVEVPLLFIYHTSKKFALTAGPAFGTLVFSEEDDQFGILKNTLPFKKFEFSGHFGLMYKLSDHLTFDGRYSRSLSTIRPFPGAYTTFFDKGQYNVLIEFSLLYGF
jgi:hypothetical protein